MANWTGSEKQIAWAQKIKAELVLDMDEFEEELKRVQNSANNDNDNDTWKLDGFADDVRLLGIQRRHGEVNVFVAIAAIRNCTEAKWFIDYGRGDARRAVHAAISGSSLMGALL